MSGFAGVAPPLNAGFFDEAGRMSLPWLRYFQSIADRVVTQEQVSSVASTAAADLAAAAGALDVRLDVLEAGNLLARMTSAEARLTAAEGRLDAIEARLLAAGIP